MSANQIEERRIFTQTRSEPTRAKPERSKPKQIPVSRTVVNRRVRVEPIRRYSIPPVTDDEEMRFVRNAVIWMAVIAVTPLILFHIITFFYPDIFMIPVAP
ncbi:MAG: hypothetical protein KDA52_20110 [Planctomycetaceae bacterium]|nr:hypothetical protein [Planctomycetaceae bacterium]